ncbi:MAG: carbon-nitrogen hydrolase [Gammaproteobacteria bacterium]|nr:carbon-nitrogen hydrolase [Gammaproteobacteria bacterium]
MTGQDPSWLTVGVVQYAAEADSDRNLENALSGIRGAARDGAELVLLPELHNHRYFCQSENPAFFDLAEPIPGPTTGKLADCAREFGLCIVGSVFERRAAGIYHNTAVVLDADGSLCGTYRKMHIPDDPGYHEKFYFTPGDQGFVPIDTSVGRLGVMVCWDQWYPEAARLMALSGAEFLLYPTAIGWDPNDASDEKQRQLDSWHTIQRAHAIANGLPVVCCNRVGREIHPETGTGLDFWGASFVCGPQGETLWQADTHRSEVGVVRVNRARSEEIRRIWPFLRDRRIDAYADLVKRARD